MNELKFKLGQLVVIFWDTGNQPPSTETVFGNIVEIQIPSPWYNKGYISIKRLDGFTVHMDFDDARIVPLPSKDILDA
tara:strand:+ start:572 stop:805 length:234 start_codon:yes stop_codon:yes gene_type:complete